MNPTSTLHLERDQLGMVLTGLQEVEKKVKKAVQLAAELNSRPMMGTAMRQRAQLDVAILAVKKEIKRQGWSMPPKLTVDDPLQMAMAITDKKPRVCENCESLLAADTPPDRPYCSEACEEAAKPYTVEVEIGRASAEADRIGATV